MIKIISDFNEIKRLQEQFQKKLSNFMNEKIDCWIGYHGGSDKYKVVYSEKLNIWTVYFDYNKIRINLFGIGKPIEGGNNSITGQINFPFEKINYRVAGVFAIEDNKNILVLHSGKIGGGKPGVGKNLFVDNFRGDFVTANDGKSDHKFCLVGELNSELFPRQVANFIFEIKRIKDIHDKAQDNNFNILNSFQFTEEHSGQTITKKIEKRTIKRTHGIIVNALARELEKRNYQVGNDINRDLYIFHKNKISTLFEIKTSSATQNVYSAVGQLIIYSIPIINDLKMIIVLPDKLNKVVEKRLENHGIKPLYFYWNNNIPTFKGLDNLLHE